MVMFALAFLLAVLPVSCIDSALLPFEPLVAERPNLYHNISKLHGKGSIEARQYCSSGYSCGDAFCVPSSDYVCCDYDSYSCNPGQDCCEGGCIPEGTQCCVGGKYCPAGNHCYIVDGDIDCCTNSACTAYVDPNGYTTQAGGQTYSYEQTYYTTQYYQTTYEVETTSTYEFDLTITYITYYYTEYILESTETYFYTTFYIYATAYADARATFTSYSESIYSSLENQATPSATPSMPPNTGGYTITSAGGGYTSFGGLPTVTTGPNTVVYTQTIATGGGTPSITVPSPTQFTGGANPGARFSPGCSGLEAFSVTGAALASAISFIMMMWL